MDGPKEGEVLHLMLAIFVQSGVLEGTRVFEYAGISSGIPIGELARRYPNSTISATTIFVSPKDLHDHITQIHPYDPGNPVMGLRIYFESPGIGSLAQRHPPCAVIERSVVRKYGKPASVGEGFEEAAQYRTSRWQIGREHVDLSCVRFDKRSRYFAIGLFVVRMVPKA